MYDAIQKLDKKFDLLHRKVSEMQHARIKPILLKPVSIKYLRFIFALIFSFFLIILKNPYPFTKIKISSKIVDFECISIQLFELSDYVPASVSCVTDWWPQIGSDPHQIQDTVTDAVKFHLYLYLYEQK